MESEMPGLWQEDSSSRWFSNQRIKCELCGECRDKTLEIVDQKTGRRIFACFLSEPACAHKAITSIFGGHLTKYNEDYLWARVIEHKPCSKSPKKHKGPVGLSKRYQVLKRDGFQCNICGATGKEARLEVDHIIPRSKGGSDNQDNLQVLCFQCNRGKRDH